MISSRQNRRVKSIRSLGGCKDAYAFLEGPHLLEEWRRSEIELVELLATREFLDGPTGHLVASVSSLEPLVVSESVLSSLVDAGSPQGVLAVVKLPRSSSISLPLVHTGIYLLLEGVQDPGNLGAIVRSAEATAVTGIALCPGGAHPNHPKALRASAGSLLRVPTDIGVSARDLLEYLAVTSPRLIGLDSNGGRDLYSSPLTGTLVLAVGSEGAGLTSDLRALADEVVSIPSAEPVESLNAAVAVSVVLHELARRRRAGRPAGPLAG